MSADLWRAQYYKCCYCERKIPEKFNDVEHYRPKGSAKRAPGCNQTHGYWWMAFDWQNLLFACPACNRSGKNDAFPLAAGSVSLQAEFSAPGAELPLLIDPSDLVNPVEHLEFFALRPSSSSSFDWWVRGRNGSLKGQTTIAVLKLNGMEYRETRRDYFDTSIKPAVIALDRALKEGHQARIDEAVDRARALLAPRLPYVAFSYDALNFLISSSRLLAAGVAGWPQLVDVGR
ncbi:hypothetical protein VLK31_09720 [Variovorax sp. H27-G14]|uniref:hypothetical protein n=1 Tax=Variovorax sp. H27-G14 TaxID=3111914 RepID=UPI0038FBE735